MLLPLAGGARYRPVATIRHQTGTQVADGHHVLTGYDKFRGHTVRCVTLLQTARLLVSPLKEKTLRPVDRADRSHFFRSQLGPMIVGTRKFHPPIISGRDLTLQRPESEISMD